jgi:vitamin B12 transporter
MASNTLRMNGTENVVLLIDGVRANHTGQKLQAPYLDLDNVQSIEVLKGAASALYGSDAKGGVISIITRKPVGNQSTIVISGGSFGAEQYKLHNEGKEKSWSYSIDVGKERRIGRHSDDIGIALHARE